MPDIIGHTGQGFPKVTGLGRVSPSKPSRFFTARRKPTTRTSGFPTSTDNPIPQFVMTTDWEAKAQTDPEYVRMVYNYFLPHMKELTRRQMVPTLAERAFETPEEKREAELETFREETEITTEAVGERAEIVTRELEERGVVKSKREIAFAEVKFLLDQALIGEKRGTEETILRDTYGMLESGKMPDNYKLRFFMNRIGVPEKKEKPIENIISDWFKEAEETGTDEARMEAAEKAGRLLSLSSKDYHLAKMKIEAKPTPVPTPAAERTADKLDIERRWRAGEFVTAKEKSFAGIDLTPEEEEGLGIAKDPSFVEKTENRIMLLEWFTDSANFPDDIVALASFDRDEDIKEVFSLSEIEEMRGMIQRRWTEAKRGIIKRVLGWDKYAAPE